MRGSYGDGPKKQERSESGGKIIEKINRKILKENAFGLYFTFTNFTRVGTIRILIQRGEKQLMMSSTTFEDFKKKMKIQHAKI